MTSVATAARRTGTCRVGCSGWNYKHWRGRFYPDALRPDAWLEYYAERFDTVELNASFYRLPEASTFERWRSRAPDGFVFAVKASRYLTHVRKLLGPKAPLELLLERAGRLGPALGPLLYQLPPRFRANAERLETMVGLLQASLRHAFEFRDPSWYAPEVLEVVARPNVTVCLHDMPGSAFDAERVGGFSYLRFHGSGGRHAGRYDDRTLVAWAQWIRQEVLDGRDVYAYFNNDIDGHAPRDAARLRMLVTDGGGSGVGGADEQVGVH